MTGVSNSGTAFPSTFISNWAHNYPVSLRRVPPFWTRQPAICQQNDSNHTYTARYVSYKTIKSTPGQNVKTAGHPLKEVRQDLDLVELKTMILSPLQSGKYYETLYIKRSMHDFKVIILPLNGAIRVVESFV